MKKILFICTGNTCRSSMAEAIAKAIISRKNMENELEVTSAGIAALPGMGAAENAIQAVAEKGIDLKGHQAKQLTVELIKDSDLILTMTGRHKAYILDMVPEVRDKVFTIKEYVQKCTGDTAGKIEDTDIADPFGQPLEIYRECAHELESLLEKIIN